MPQYAPDTIDDMRLALRGLSPRMEVEIEPGIPLATHTVADLRAQVGAPGVYYAAPGYAYRYYEPGWNGYYARPAWHGHRHYGHYQ